MNLNNAATEIWNGIYIFVAFAAIILSLWYAKPRDGGKWNTNILITGIIITAVAVALLFNPGNIRGLGDTILGWFGIG